MEAICLPEQHIHKRALLYCIVIFFTRFKRQIRVFFVVQTKWFRNLRIFVLNILSPSSLRFIKVTVIFMLEPSSSASTWCFVSSTVMGPTNILIAGTSTTMLSKEGSGPAVFSSSPEKIMSLPKGIWRPRPNSSPCRRWWHGRRLKVKGRLGK